MLLFEVFNNFSHKKIEETKILSFQTNFLAFFVKIYYIIAMQQLILFKADFAADVFIQIQ